VARILITSDYEYSGDKLDIGSYYFCQKDDNGTLQQNSLFHALLDIFYKSGCYSYPVDNYTDFRNYVKEHLGAGYESYFFMYESDNGLAEGRVKKLEDVPVLKLGIKADGNKMLWGDLKSWSKYTKKERMETINRLLVDMDNSGINSAKYFEIRKELEG